MEWKDGTYRLILLVLVLHQTYDFVVSDNANANIPSILDKLSAKISQSQVKRQTIEYPPLSWKRDKGLYDSRVKLNFHGSPQMALMRDEFEIFDNNMFATSWVTSCLLEAHLYGEGLMPNKEDLQLAISAINQFHDHNSPHNTSLMTFWPQSLNKTTGMWISTPENLLALFDLTDHFPLKTVESLLHMIGLSSIADVMEHLVKEKEMFASAFRLPADFDDTFVNIGLGALLLESGENFIDEFKLWQSANTNLSSAYDALRRYAYRPRSDNEAINTIDPRTYYYMHDFYQQRLQNTSQPAFVTTWAQDTKEAMIMNTKGVAMPFFVNNVDVTVASNTIYGISASILSGLVNDTHFDADVQAIYEHSGDLITYEISHNFSSRRDLALTYYPSKFECYWFNSRTLVLLRRHSQKTTLKYKVMSDLLLKLDKAFTEFVTDDIISSANNDSHGNIFFDDFLGNGDFNSRNESEKRPEDRIFTTSMALNTLLNVYTTYDVTTRKNIWIKDTPAIVRQVVKGTVHWLSTNVVSGTYKPWNAFFSGSGKGLESMPFWYPANKVQYLNGTDYRGNTLPHGLFMIALQGMVAKETYDAMIEEPHFGKPTPRDFSGYNPVNSPQGFFPFWSSDSYTYATTALALSKYLNTQ
ncbi:hypothetical protein FSP39_018512 [Pinctada imbricata]|uniref:Uncharacterized protein n=1 Tax=Pinctada imbricata TaxID=66713 RepID=A0AA88YGQ7_PINIB|nr:hypothetical protein FSP39_018512 [Pinctada imbricata]